VGRFLGRTAVCPTVRVVIGGRPSVQDYGQVGLSDRSAAVLVAGSLPSAIQRRTVRSDVGARAAASRTDRYAAVVRSVAPARKPALRRGHK
jgi:hypothetical protein